jgi:hypothetical protein
MKEKLAAIAEAIRQLEGTERTLIDAGVKPFYEMHKNIKKKDDSHRHQGYGYIAPVPKTYESVWDFSTPDMNDSKRDGYVRLFEAAWAGDFATVKAMTLVPWSSANEPPANPPLQIAIRDSNGFSPFSIAVLKGHRDLARRMIDICLAQYHKDDIKGQRQRWQMVTDNDNDSEISGGDDEHVLPIFAELVNDKFTVDNLGEVSDIVKSNVMPLAMINWNCDVGRIDEPVVNNGRYDTLIQHAVNTDNMGLLKFVIEIGAEQQTLLAEEDDDQRCFNIDSSVFISAIRLGRTAMLGEMIEASGVGIPLNDLVQKSGVELKKKPRYYQGLSVGGKKRADWAQAPDAYETRVIEEKIPSLLRAANLGSIESLEWFMSDAPMRRYKQFAESNANDKRIQTLKESGKGFEKTIATWMNAQSNFLYSVFVSNLLTLS